MSNVGLTVNVLGDLQLRVAGRDCALPPSRKTRALFAYLALSGRPQRRQRLCEMFWEVPDDPRGALRWSLSKLRGVLGEERGLIEADRDRVALVLPDEAIDLERYARLIREGRADLPHMREALEALHRPVLADCELPACEAYSAWLTALRNEAETLAATLGRALEAAEGAAVSPAALTAAPWAALAENAPEATALEERQTVRFCQAGDGTSLAWAQVGATGGMPLVKAANWLTHLDLDWDAPIWSPLFRDLGKDHCLVRYDERGCGLSDWDVEDISFEAFVTDLEAVVDAAGLTRFPLLGISQGASVSIEYAALHPDKVSHLILFGGYAAGWRHTATKEEARERKAVMVLTEAGWGRDDPAYRHIFSQTFMPSASAEELRWFDEFQRRTTTPRNAVRFLDAFSRIDVRHRLRTLDVPTLVLHSHGDQRIPLSVGRRLAASIPGATFVGLDSENHLLLGREPASAAFVKAIRDFLSV